jgi:hypothetical protein
MTSKCDSQIWSGKTSNFFKPPLFSPALSDPQNARVDTVVIAGAV